MDLVVCAEEYTNQTKIFDRVLYTSLKTGVCELCGYPASMHASINATVYKGNNSPGPVELCPTDVVFKWLYYNHHNEVPMYTICSNKEFLNSFIHESDFYEKLDILESTKDKL